MTTSNAWAGQTSEAKWALRCDDPLVLVDDGSSGSARCPPLLNSCVLHRFRPGANKYSFSLGLETLDGSTGSREELQGVVSTTWLVDPIAIQKSILDLHSQVSSFSLLGTWIGQCWPQTDYVIPLLCDEFVGIGETACIGLHAVSRCMWVGAENRNSLGQISYSSNIHNICPPNHIHLVFVDIFVERLRFCIEGLHASGWGNRFWKFFNFALVALWQTQQRRESLQAQKSKVCKSAPDKIANRNLGVACPGWKEHIL